MTASNHDRDTDVLPLCLNQDGSLWDLYDVSHTPFTAVVFNGKVVYLNDQDLLKPGSRQQFIRDLRSLSLWAN
jgi:hypothetical protein